MFESYTVAELLKMLAVVAAPAIAGVAYILARDATAPQRWKNDSFMDIFGDDEETEAKASPQERLDDLSGVYGRALTTRSDLLLLARLDDLDDEETLAFLDAYTQAKEAVAQWHAGDLGEKKARRAVKAARLAWVTLAGDAHAVGSDEPHAKTPFEARRSEIARRGTTAP